MKRWPTKPLAEIATLVRGVSFGGSDASGTQKDGTVPILRAGNIQDSLLTDSDLVFVPGDLVSGEQRMRAGDLAICMSSGSPAMVGKTAYLASDWCGSVGAFCAIVRFNAKLHHRFGSYWFRSPEFLRWRDRNAKGANIQNLRRAELESLPLPLPPLAEQERIVKLLDEADGLRKLRAQADRRTANLIPALFHEMFGDPVANPKGWPIQCLGDLFDRVRGGAKCGPFGSALKRHEYVATGIPVWGIPNVLPNRFVGAGSLFISREKFQELKAYVVEPGDLLFSRAGTVGRVCVLPPALGESIMGSNVIRLALDQARVAPEFLCALLTYFSKDIGSLRANVDEGAYSFMNTGVLKGLSIFLPPLPIQQEFARRSNQIRDLEAAQATSRAHLDALFQSMLHRAFNGEL